MPDRKEMMNKAIDRALAVAVSGKEELIAPAGAAAAALLAALILQEQAEQHAVDAAIDLEERELRAERHDADHTARMGELEQRAALRKIRMDTIAVLMKKGGELEEADMDTLKRIGALL